MRKLALLFFLTLLVLVSTFIYLDHQALKKLSSMGVSYERLDRGLFRRDFYGVRYRGVYAKHVRAYLLSPRNVEVQGVTVSINPNAGKNKLGAEAPLTLPTKLSAKLKDVAIYWKKKEVASGLYGQMKKGRLVLDAPGVHITSGPDALRVDWDGEMPSDTLSGLTSVEIERGGRLSIEANAPLFFVRHKDVHSGPVRLEDGTLSLEGDRLGKQLSGQLVVDGLEFDVVVHRSNREFDVDLRLDPTPIDKALTPFHSVIPEAKKGSLEGKIDGDIQIQWPAKSWDGTVNIENFRSTGSVPKIQNLRRGPIEYYGLDKEGYRSVLVTGEGQTNWTPLEEISPSMRHAVIAAEDIRFQKHAGYDLESIRDAYRANKKAGTIVRGGSTLSQQVAKNLFLDGERTMVRKIREVLLANELDQSLGKGRILEIYLNVVEWGPGIYGIKAASERFFMRRPSQLQPHESAFLAAILPNPRRFYRDQYLKNKARQTRIDWILKNMGTAGRLQPHEVERWSTAPLRFVPPPSTP